MNLIIDHGNSLCKVALVKNDTIHSIHKFKQLSINILKEIITKHAINKCIYSSVSGNNEAEIHFLKTNFKNFIQLSSTTKIPIKIDYKTPESLGNDRIAGAVAANFLYPNTNCIIIDFGTAITIDFIDNNGIFCGGNISPGLQTRFISLHKQTQKLPLCKPNHLFFTIGKSTEEAIVSGVQLGIKYEIEGYLNLAQNKYTDFKVIFTGGDARVFDKLIKNPIFAQPNLILIGLNRILDYND